MYYTAWRSAPLQLLAADASANPRLWQRFCPGPTFVNLEIFTATDPINMWTPNKWLMVSDLVWKWVGRTHQRQAFVLVNQMPRVRKHGESGSYWLQMSMPIVLSHVVAIDQKKGARPRGISASKKQRPRHRSQSFTLRSAVETANAIDQLTSD